MKKHIIQSLPLRRAAGKWILAAFVTAAAATTQAQTGSTTESFAKTASIKSVAGEATEQNFLVSYPNEEGNRFNLTITDQAGNNLYKATYSDKNFSKVFKVPGLEQGKLIFIFRDSKTNSTQTYEVNTEIRNYQEVKVKRIS